MLLLALILLFASCDKEVNDIGANVLGNDHYGLNKYAVQNLVAYNKSTGDVQTSNIQLAQFGIYDDPVFGKVTASVGTQLLLAAPSSDLNFTVPPTIVSVFLNVPYLASPKNTADASPKDYNLESIYGSDSNKIKLSVFRSNNTIGDVGDNKRVNEPQRYYSNIDFDSFKIGARLNNGDSSENDEFIFKNSENIEKIYTYTTATSTTPSEEKVEDKYLAPGLRVKLDNSFGDVVFLAKSKLANNTDFKQYYKGLFFKVEESSLSTSGRLALMDFRKGTVKIIYSESGSTIKKELILNMSGAVVNSLKNIDNPVYISALVNANPITGDENLYLKGGKGSVAIIDVFGKDLNDADGLTPISKIVDGNVVLGNGIADELDIIRKDKWLINEANLVFNVDQSKMTSPNQPLRISIYNVNTKNELIDFTIDGSADKNIFSSVNENSLTKITKYKIRITNFIKNLILNGGEDIKLGVHVSQNILNVGFGTTSTLPEYDDLLWNIKGLNYQNSFFFPNGSIISPLGTVLYGTNRTDSNKLKLEIWYSKPN